MGREIPSLYLEQKKCKGKRGFILGNNQNVLKLLLLTNRGRVIDGIYFGDIEQFEEKMCRKFGKDELNKMYSRRR